MDETSTDVVMSAGPRFNTAERVELFCGLSQVGGEGTAAHAGVGFRVGGWLRRPVRRRHGRECDGAFGQRRVALLKVRGRLRRLRLATSGQGYRLKRRIRGPLRDWRQRPVAQLAVGGVWRIR